MRYFDGETYRIPYRAKRNTTGLTDVKIDIWDGGGTKLVDAGTLTELASGLYYYDYAIPSTGNFIFNITCATQPHDVEGTFVAVGRQSPYWNKRGGGSIITGPVIDAETRDMMKEIIRLLKQASKEFLKKKDFDSEGNAILQNKLTSFEARFQELEKDTKTINELALKSIPTDVLLGE